MDEAEPEVGYGLVMPFVTVASKGGPHDDESYVAGYAMGLLDGKLKIAAAHGFDRIPQMVRDTCTAQADLIAMRHGYRTRQHHFDDGWVEVEFLLMDDGDGD